MLYLKAKLISNKRLAALSVILIAAVLFTVLLMGILPNVSDKPAEALSLVTPSDYTDGGTIQNGTINIYIDGEYLVIDNWNDTVKNYRYAELLFSKHWKPVEIYTNSDFLNGDYRYGASNVYSLATLRTTRDGPHGSIITTTPQVIQSYLVNGSLRLRINDLIEYSSDTVSIDYEIDDDCTFVVYYHTTVSSGDSGHDATRYFSNRVMYYLGSKSLPETPTRENYTFDGWYYDEAFTNPYVEGDIIHHDTVLYPKWQINNYHVQFYVQGAKYFDGQLDYNTQLEAPEITGYTFEGWYTDSALTISHDGIVKSNITLYTKYAPIPYTLRVYGFDNVLIYEDILYYGDTFYTSSLHIPTVEGYTFEGWYNGSFVSEIVVNSSTDLYATYNINTYDIVIYNGDDVLYEETEVFYGTELEDFEAPVIPGYTFDNLYLDSDFTIVYNVTVVTGNITAYARYNPIIYNYTVYGYNGAILDVGSVYYGDILTLEAPEIPGSTFIGWYTDSEYTTEFDVESPILTDTSIYAKYDIKLYTVKIYGVDSILTTLNLIGGSYIPANDQIAPVVEGYTFVGWYTDSDFVTLYDFDSPIQSTTNIFAKYTADTYSIKLYGGVTGEILLDTLTVTHGELVNPADLVAPEITGYVFFNWRINGVTAFDISNPITSQYNLIANYHRSEYQVIFYGFDLSVDFDLFILSNYTLSTLSSFRNPEIPLGYNFDGWYLDSNFITPVDGSYIVTDTVNLYPKYSIKTFDYVIYGFNGVELHSDTLDYGSTIPIEFFVAPPVTGYNFVAWYRDASLNYAFNASVPLKSNVNIYAKYTKKAFNVSCYGYEKLLLYSGVCSYGDTVNEGALNYSEVTGHTFEGWYIDERKTVKYNPESGVYQNLTLYANYVRNTYEYKVYGFNNEVIESGEIVYGDNLPVFEAPEVAGYSFVGFFTDASCDYAYDPIATVQNNLYVYASYTSVQFDYIVYGYDDVVLAEGEVYYGNLIPVVTAPSVAGNTFMGWYLDTDYTTPFAFTTAVHEEPTIYAKYINTSYTYVAYGFNNEVLDTDTLNYGQIVPSIAVPDVEGYVFDGWYTSNTYEVEYDFDNAPNADVVLYAKYVVAPELEPEPESEEPAVRSANTWAIIGGSLALVLLIGGIFFLVKKVFYKKKF